MTVKATPFNERNIPFQTEADALLDFRFGSKPEVQRGPRNVRCWGESGSRFWEAGGLLLAVVSIDRRNTLIFDVTKKECWNELQTSDLFYE